MLRSIKLCTVGCIAVLLMASLHAGAQSRDNDGFATSAAQNPSPVIDRDNVGLDQKLNSQVPLDIPFRDESGKTLPLSAYFGARPVLLMMPFYRCPGICTLEMDGLTKSLVQTPFVAGKEFDVVIVSINPKEDAALATQKKLEYMKLYSHPGSEVGWHFLTGTESSIKRLAAAVGYRYVYNVKTDQYVHPAGLMVLTPTGKLSRYFYGAAYNPKDIRLSLVEASANRIGSPVDQIILMCYHYDPIQGRYGLVVMNVIRLTALATIVTLGALIFLMLRIEKAVSRRAAARPDKRKPLPNH